MLSIEKKNLFKEDDSPSISLKFIISKLSGYYVAFVELWMLCFQFMHFVYFLGLHMEAF